MTEIKEQLVKHINEAYAMELSVLRMLDGMIETTDDPQILDDLERHRMETRAHAERMEQRLNAHGAEPSTVKGLGGILASTLKGVVDMARSDQAGHNARDGYATEHLEIATYQLLERIAQRAGDEETAEAARQNRADEESMVRKIEANWDRFAELSLLGQGVRD